MPPGGNLPGETNRATITLQGNACTTNGELPGRAEFAGPAADALARLEAVTAWLGEQARENPDELGAASADYLRLFDRLWSTPH